jgi:hypothetical protein
MRILFVNAVGPTDISAVETETVHQLSTTIGLQTDLANATSEIASLLKRLAHVPRRAILPHAPSTGTLTLTGSFLTSATTKRTRIPTRVSSIRTRMAFSQRAPRPTPGRRKSSCPLVRSDDARS